MSAGPQLAFDRATGVFAGASAREQLAAYAFQAGARLSSAWSYRGFAAGCRAVRSVLIERDITVRLNEDALFAFPYGDGYWTLLLDRNYRYEADIELFFRGIADDDYTLVDCGANLRLLVGADDQQAVWRTPGDRDRAFVAEFRQAHAQREDQRQSLQGDAARDRRHSRASRGSQGPSTRR